MKIRREKGRWRQAIAGILAAVLCTEWMPVPLVSAENFSQGEAVKAEMEMKEQPLLAHYDFQSLEDHVILDVSGNEYHGTIKGEGAKISEGGLALPGGASGSSAAYVELPKGMFDSRNTLTISLWLKNQTGSGNYAAMYFGTESTSHYWLMNPENPAGTYKSVVTKDSFRGEYGFSPTNASNGTAGPAASKEYALYTTVIEPGRMTLYYNGKNCGTVDTGISVSEFGSDLSAYLGRSPYPDIFFKGIIRDVKIYEKALTEYEMTDIYYNEVQDPEIPKAALRKDKEILQIGKSDIVSNLVLPERGENGSVIAWSSSKPQYLSADGTISRPDAQTGDVTVTLTAKMSLGSQTETKTFEVKVLADTPENNVQSALEEFELGQSIAVEDLALPSSLEGGISLSWKSSAPAVISDTGKITRPQSGEGNIPVTLTVTASFQGSVKTKEFQVEVVEQPYGKILTYVRAGNTERTDALHYGFSRDGKQYTALNNNRPILYWNQLLERKMGSPSLFRKADGSYGLIASDDNNSTEVILYDSSDLLRFTNPRTISLNRQQIKVKNPVCRYDSASRSYIISYQGGDGEFYDVKTEDFRTLDAPENSSCQKAEVTGALPEGAVEADVFEVTQKEYETILNKWQRVVNTNVSELDDIVIEKNGVFSIESLPKQATANYSDGSTKQFGIQWNQQDLAKIDTSRPGNYQISGTLNQPAYSDVLVEQRADPWTFLGDDGYYYFTGSYPVCGTEEERQGIGYDRIVLRRSKTLQGLKDAEEVTIWHADDDPSTYRYIWAPEIHQINGKWYVFFTISRSRNNPYDIRPYVLECRGNDPMDKSNWNMRKMEPAAGDDFALSQFSLDMTHFESAGIHYVAWAEKPGNGVFSNIYIASIDPQKPWQLTSRCTEVTVPDFAWENPINEGPAVIKNHGNVYLCFSAAAVNFTYCVGMLSAKEGDDLLDADSWSKYPIPLLSTDDLVNQCGPGHNSFTVDENGNPVIVYHARPVLECSSGGDWNGTVGRCQYIEPGENSLIDPCRHARIKSVNFAADGTPILNMTPEEELKTENKIINLTLTVKDSTVTSPISSKVKTVRLSKEKYVYDGKAKKPKIVVKDETGKTISSNYYNVSYPKGRKQPGIYQVKVTMKNGYKGTYKRSFQICPRQVSVKKAEKQEGGFKFSWKKPRSSENITGYEIEYSTSRKFSKKVTVSKLLKKSKTAYQVKNLKKGKKYYIRIRAYKKVSGSGKKAVFSKWSKTKMATAK